jgi:hypothetical protein
MLIRYTTKIIYDKIDLFFFFFNFSFLLTKDFIFGKYKRGVRPFTQAYIYKIFCISRILYGLEIMNLNKKTISTLNLNQNNIVRYMTGLSKHSHV